jgi:hypothetical protein
LPDPRRRPCCYSCALHEFVGETAWNDARRPLARRARSSRASRCRPFTHAARSMMMISPDGRYHASLDGPHHRPPANVGGSLFCLRFRRDVVACDGVRIKLHDPCHRVPDLISQALVVFVCFRYTVSRLLRSGRALSPLLDRWRARSCYDMPVFPQVADCLGGRIKKVSPQMVV